MLLSPVALLLLALLLLAAAVRWRRARLRVVAILLLLFALASMTPLLANALVGALEDRAVAADEEDCDRLQAVVFLSGGVRRAPASGSDVAALTADTVARVLGLAEHQGQGGLPLVVSGGGPYSVAESDVVASLMLRLGIASDHVLLESDSQTTWDSAFAVRRLLPPATRRIALASSALHLPRAMLVYRAAGFTVCPWPLRARFQEPRGPWAVWPQSSALTKTEAAWHELLGQLWYRLRLEFGERG